MDNQDWLVTGKGQSVDCQSSEGDQECEGSFRLYRFLTEIEDVLRLEADDQLRLDKIRPLVRQLLNTSAWLQYEFKPPNPKTGWSVNRLYNEPGFPLTVQMVAWAPGETSTIHNHGAWGVVALVSGQEKNTLWHRTPTTAHPDRIESTKEVVINPGDIISFLPDAIHCVEALGDEPTISFNLYGKTDYKARYKFDVQTHTAMLF